MLGKDVIKKVIVVSVLAGAIAMSILAQGVFTWAGIIYYALCAAAVIKKYKYALVMLWAAVVVHTALVGYSLYSTQICPYCLAAAGFVLVAAVAAWKPAITVLPALLIAGIWYAWPWIAPAEYNFEYSRTNYYVFEQPPEDSQRPVKPSEPLKLVKPG